MLLPGGATRTGMVPDPATVGPAPAGPGAPRNLLEPEIMGPPIAWLASAEASGVTDERIVATEFSQWLSDRRTA
jgi:gluconate 5-dehydrogenase